VKGIVSIENFSALLAELIESMVAVDYWSIHTVGHPEVGKYLGEGTLGNHSAGLILHPQRRYDLVVGLTLMRRLWV
jgi:hypothetical protein